ncbi:TetR/AcrR family transcriptional regulator [Curtobacterium ammoniigenes]|uniref:TetR/AcrR family transcriptional regulator n=1 Tax=Curtobacterium ammoniigenes TaxID=395387 RepID=UPI00082E5798|nr:TetR/AcrR family transcriptional regulator [Curtobacterium ammoniigenes]
MGVREDQRRRTRHAILLAAAHEFERDGYESTSYQAIAARAGVMKSLVSYHFPSKNDFVRAMFDAAFREQRYPSPSMPPLPPLDDLAFTTVHSAAQEQRNPIVRAAIRLQRESDRIPDVAIPKPFVLWLHRCERMIGVAATRGEVPVHVDVLFEAQLLVAQYVGLRDLAAAAGSYDTFVEQTAIGTLDRFAAMGATHDALRSATHRTVAEMTGLHSAGVSRVAARLSS